MGIAQNLEKIQQRIQRACERVGRDPDEVELLAVTKYVGTPQIEELAGLGVRAFGESRMNQARTRLEAYPDFAWHFVGSLQRNKVRHCAGFSLIHSLDRYSLAEDVNRRGEQWGTVVNMLIQVNVSGEDAKSGLPVEEVPALAERVGLNLPYVRVRGLMTMAPLVEPEECRKYFRCLRQLQLQLASKTGWDLDVLSMGMSNDFEIAIEEGATLVRIGTALFSEEG